MATAQQYREALQAQLDDMLSMLERVVNIDSGSYDGVGVNRVQDEFEAHLRDTGFETARTPLAGYGDQLTARWQGSADAPRVLILGHADTVWPAGTAAQWPYSRQGELLHGPGVGDMKGCVVMALFALRELVRGNHAHLVNVTVLIVPDEEIGSPGSRAWIESEAAQADVCLTLEPARAGRGLVVGRGAVGAASIEATGLTAHAGHGRAAGASAVAALAPLVNAIEALTDASLGVSTSVGLFSGGEARQVIAAQAEMKVDLRAQDEAGVAYLTKGIESCVRHARSIADPRVQIEHTTHFTRPPFPDGRRTNRLYAMAAEICETLGVGVKAVVSPGGSDGSFGGAMGVPTLDGLGPIVHEMCSRRERLEIDSIAVNGALLATLITRIGQPGSRYNEPESTT